MKLKNTYGYSIQIDKLSFDSDGVLKEFGGSSLDRKKSIPKTKTITDEEILLSELDNDTPQRHGEIAAEMSIKIKKSDVQLNEIKVIEATKQRYMSQRTKTKIRKKIIAWSQIQKKLYFVTLTFLNAVEDEQAVNLLRKFLDNAKKRKKGFEYLWVAERQKKNTIFPDNIHFHIITNKSFEAKKYMKYWIDLQNKNNVFARIENFNPASAFDVKAINATNIKRLTMYLTKYVTKNVDVFNCQVWNCSKFVSALYTDFYTYSEITPFLDQFKRVAEVTEKKLDYDFFKSTLFLIPLNKTTLRMYNKLDEKNLEICRK